MLGIFKFDRLLLGALSALCMYNSLASNLCEKTEYFQMEYGTYFYISVFNHPQITGDNIQLSPRAIDELMCFAKSNLYEHSCLSIHLTSPDKTRIWLFTGVLHPLPENSLFGNPEILRINDNVGLFDGAWSLCSICRNAGNEVELSDLFIRHEKGGELFEINDCEKMVGDKEMYNIYFNSQTQDVGLTTKSR